MRAIASANEESTAAKVKEQRDVANKMERIENQASINESINNSVKEEEVKIIDAANKRMAEVNSKKASQANEAAQDIQKAQEESKKAQKEAREKENKAIKEAIKKHSDTVVAK